MGEYRLLANSMWVGEKNETRAKRGEIVEVDDKRAESLLAANMLVKKGEETDAQKKEFEGVDKTAEAREADRRAIKEQEAALVKQGGEHDNKTVKPEPSQPAGAPNVKRDR